MSKFTEIGVMKQMNARTKEEAIEAYEESCSICCLSPYTNGLCCDRCPIYNAHLNALEIMDVKTEFYKRLNEKRKGK